MAVATPAERQHGGAERDPECRRREREDDDLPARGGRCQDPVDDPGALLDELAGDVGQRRESGEPGAERRDQADRDDGDPERAREGADPVADGAEQEAGEEDTAGWKRLQQAARDRLSEPERDKAQRADQRDRGARGAELVLPGLDEEPERPARPISDEPHEREGAQADREPIAHRSWKRTSCSATSGRILRA
jgi:hypothetical protein